MFPTNEIYLAHVICYVDGERKGSGAMKDGILLNRISALDKPNNETLIPRDQLDVPVTRIATVYLKAKLEWFSQQKSNKVEENSFKNDQLCMLVLGCYIITNIPQNLKNLLFYKQEQICHSRWITIANGYMKMFIFNSKNLTDTQKNKLQKIVSYIVCVYVPSFLMIRLNPKAPEDPFIFHHDLLSCFVEIDPNITDVVMKYSISWLIRRNGFFGKMLL